MRLEDALPGVPVRYIPGHAHGDLAHPDCEDGRVSSTNEVFVFVRFNKTVAKLGWEGTTSQSCKPEDLVLMDPLGMQAARDFLDAEVPTPTEEQLRAEQLRQWEEEEPGSTTVTSWLDRPEFKGGMSNYNFSIAEGVEDALRTGEFHAAYAGWNFRGYVWFDAGLFKCEVWVDRVAREVLEAPTLHDMMHVVSRKYGYE